MKNVNFILFLIIAIFISSCIGDDVLDDQIPEEVRILNPVDSLVVGSTHQFDTRYFNEVGTQVSADISYTSSDNSILSITNEGLATALEVGSASVTASVGSVISDVLNITITENPVDVGGNSRDGSIRTTSAYVLEGTFLLAETSGGLNLTLNSDFKASSGLPGLYVYLGNNPNSIADALEISPVTQFTGEHSYFIENALLREYEYVLFWCKPFQVKVGEGNFNN